ncbi:monosaccharide ABC transporter substrate-binding protein (CUT2 family) [Saccharopolyspora erythraea NRRL 2338]|uniref:Ribose ABC transporter binding protein n=2 Tax=Saccharopolyspora erythraea TaxID=1836 RepID=A4FMX8_SACEN|nr:ABC transporter substrate-binding protein [Saccharopolyspora erythraea]EQD84924.1 sugar ABC transporter substrate-binding protein [Saccharopolyspora erythraea D]PFG99047.1 monosaccharide ABC transporter substrate-binding protein (CUT2 family) [Saccharopolyspora erythraea NRRL 2338]QRK89010.1 substrate-binding domain-containing protein [Saccharopolyspora erythraea]CAM05403.1 ribose ABC transporter binding protein [Saccharopolyspora erythraea NRRL 2338]
MRRHILAVASVLLLAGCGSGQIGDTGGGQTDPNNRNLALLTGMRGEPFYVSMECAAKQQAAAAGYNINAQAPEKFEQAEQSQMLTGIIGTRPGAVIIAPTDDKALAAPLQQAKNNGVQVVEVDTALEDRSIAVASLSSDNYAGGKLAAQTLAQLTGGKPGAVLALNTKAGTSTTDERAKGFEEEIAKHPNLRLLPTQYTENEPATAAQIVSATLAANPDLVGVFATNLNTGEGAGTALANAGRSGQVQLVGFDASPKQVEDLRNGRVQALIAQDPAAIGREGVDRAIAAIKGQPVERETRTNMIAITKDNMQAQSQYFYKSEC